VSAARLGGAVLSGVLLGATFGMLALALGAVTGSRPLAVGLSSALAVGTYLLNGLAPLVDALEPYRLASPFYFYAAADPIRNGLDPVHVLVLLGLTLAFGALAVVGFRRRDLQA
jgi:ABC-2 type transport system permease protein